MIDLKKLVFLFSFFGLLFHQNLNAQYYSTGQDPATVKWDQIKTDHFQIIFQREFEDKAQEIANILEYNYQLAGQSLNHKPKKISVVVHNQSITSNGYVAWAPKRMDLSVTPPQDLFADEWLDHLCIHELRHVVQIDKLNQGITKILSIVFGEQATGLIAGQLPMWYLEGDAVCTETSLLKMGRGRLPYFHRGIKTNLLSNGESYSFDQSLFGSYNRYIPSYYEFGYQLTSYARYKYGADIWSKVENHVAKNSYTLLPTPFVFYRGLKKNTGLSQKELYDATMNFLANSWKAEQKDKEFNRPNFIQKYNINEYEDYINPIFIDGENILALKKGLSHIPQFVLIKNDSEKIIYEPGYLVSNDFSFSNNILAWAEYKADIRWQNREFTSLKLLNIVTNREFTLVKKSRYFSPELSKDADKILVVEVDTKNKSRILILNGYNGSVIRSIQPEKDCFIQRPKWSKDEQFIYAILLDNEGKHVSRYNLNENKWEFIFKHSSADIQRILPSEKYVYYHSTLSGTDNIYAYDEITGDTYQLSDSKLGISEFSLNTNKTELITNEYTSKGFRVINIPIERALWKKVSTSDEYKFELAERLKNQELTKEQENREQDISYPVKPYRKPFHLFNFHSWIPFYVNYDEMDLGNAFADPSEVYNNIHPGITLLSQNKLSTVEAVLGYAYKNGSHYLSSSIKYKGLLPIFKITANYGNEQLIRTINGVTWVPETTTGYSYDFDVYIPFNFSSGRFIKGIRPLVSVEYFDNYYYNYQNDYYMHGLEFVESQLLLYSYERKAEKDIIPELGAIFDFRLFNTPFDSELYGYLYNVNTTFYLPGKGNTGFKFNFGYQYQNPVLYLFGSNFDFPRGIEKRRTEKMVKLYSNYVFPIAYPDWNLGSVLYLKRIRGSAFIDYAYNTYRMVNQAQTAYIWPNDHYASFGVELTADYHLLRTIFPLSTGVRVGYASTGNFFTEMMFGIDLYNF